MRARRLLLTIALTAPLLAACAASTPKIIAISPSQDAREVASNQDIRITFDRAMDRASVESHFELKPRLLGCADVNRCSFAWTGNTVAFTHPAVNFALATTYTVALHSGYADTAGLRNDLEHTWSFTTEGTPALDRIDPPDRATGVAPDRNLVLTFNHQMDATTLRGAISITPEVPFILRRRPGDDSSQIEIVPLTLLQANQPYVVAIEGAQDRHQNTMLGRVQSRFTTGAVAVPRRLGYLVGQRDQPAFGVGVVDPHPDPFLGQSTPKLIYALSELERSTEALLGFDWSPDGTRLVVVQGLRDGTEGGLLVVNLKSGQVEELRLSGSDPAWTSDGSSIVFLKGGDLHRYRLDRKLDLTLTQDGTVRAPFSLRPGGRDVAYATTDGRGASRLWIMNLELRAGYRIPGLEDPADRPAWSPDGLKLAFRRMTSTGPQLFVYDQGAETVRKVAALDVKTIAWLNDNSTLFVGVGSGADAALYRVNIFAPGEAGGLVKVTGSRDAPNGSSPSTPGYDRRVGFSSLRDGVPQIFVMNGDGSRPQALTTWDPDFPYTGEAPNWSPAGG